jgi:Excreted virulence factor EspC, type VII ESX diderm
MSMTDPFDELRVDAAHLQELADKQSEAAAEIAAATPVTVGVAASVASSHGLICARASEAAAKAEKARADACAAMEFMSSSFASNLRDAAAQYVGTDEKSGDRLDGMMRP